MATISVTYQFVNGQTSDGPQVSQNFTDIVNGLSGGSADLTIGTLKVADGTAAAPSITNQTFTTTGFYWSAGPQLNIAIGGVEAVTMVAATVSFTLATTLSLVKSSSGATETILVHNSSNTASSDALFQARVGGTSAGDAGIKLTIDSGTSWYIAADNSDSDAFVVGTGSTIGGSNKFRISGSADVSFGATGRSHTITGDLSSFTDSSTGAVAVTITNTNSSAAAGHARLNLISGGASGGDPYIYFNISGTTDWALGVDNSSSDNFVLSASSAIGTSNALVVTAAGAATLTGRLTAAGVTVSDNILASTGGSLDIGASGTRFATIFGTAINVSGNGTIAGNVLSTSGYFRTTNASGDPGAVTDEIRIGCVDISAGNASLAIRTEAAVVTESVTSDRTLQVQINGTTYKICLKA